MNIDRLTALANMLDKIPANKFNMYDYWSGTESVIPTSEEMMDSKCGTAACVAGWTITMFGDPEWIAHENETQVFWKNIPWEYAMQLLEIDEWDAEKLFLDGYSKTAPQKAEEIRALIARGPKSDD